MAATSSISGNSKSSDAYLKLRKLICDGRLNGGERLTEARAARLIGMGRGPVRESLLKLEAEGFLQHMGNKKSRVIVYTEDENREDLLFRSEMRERIEGGAAGLAAKNMNGWQIDQLRALSANVEECRQNGDSEGRYDASIALHQYLMENCGNPLLLKAWQQFRLAPTRPRGLAFEQKLMSHIPAEQRETPSFPDVVDAIAAHDEERAERLMRARVRQLIDAIRLTPFENESGNE